MKFGRFAADIRAFVPVLIISLFGLLLGFQGWKSRVPATDMLPYIDAAARFISDGTIPDSGVLTSFASYAPPGLSWFFTPGMLIFSDPRLFDSIGRITLYLLTVLGVFLLARSYFEQRSAILAAVLYGFSELGLSLASALYDRFALHFFYVWMVYWTVSWIRRNNSNFLGAAMLTYAAGVYTFPEMAPAALVFPVLWIIYRPAVKPLSLLTAGILAVAIWYPYLRFESRRNFADVKSITARQRILPKDYKKSWCDPSLTGRRKGEIDPSSKIEQQSVSSSSRLVGLMERVVHAETFLPSFDKIAHVRGLNSAFFWLTLTGILVLALPGKIARTCLGMIGSSTKFQDGLSITLIVLALLGNEFLVARFSADGVLESQTLWPIRAAQLVLLASGILLYKRRTLGTALGRVPAFRRTIDCLNAGVDAEALVLGVVIPWSVLFFIVTSDRLDRFWWLWPIQVIVLAAISSHVPSRLGFPKVALWVAEGLLFIAVAGNTLLMSRLVSWSQAGWSGPDADELQAINYIAGDIRSQGKGSAAVGYGTHDGVFLPNFNIVDPRYKMGAEFDFLLSQRHQLTNTDKCAEGFSSDDEYRILQESPPIEDSSQIHFEIPADNFQFVQKFGVYRVFKR